MRALLDKERDRLIRLAKQAIDLGLDERRARIAERDAELLVTAVRAAAADSELGLSVVGQEQLLRVVARHLREGAARGSEDVGSG